MKRIAVAIATVGLLFLGTASASARDPISVAPTADLTAVPVQASVVPVARYWYGGYPDQYYSYRYRPYGYYYGPGNYTYYPRPYYYYDRPGYYNNYSGYPGGYYYQYRGPRAYIYSY
jgi:hypothetical protein